jgi:hypothetical protein
MTPLAITIDVQVGSSSIGGTSTPPAAWSLDFSDSSTTNGAYIALF